MRCDDIKKCDLWWCKSSGKCHEEEWGNAKGHVTKSHKRLMREKQKNHYHFWVSPLDGYVWNTTATPPKQKYYGKLKYMGYTSELGWPKKMNTGRILQKPDYKAEARRTKKLKKLPV